ncbi:MAG TPA: hypothetical protein PKA38_04920 [Candidatus Levybacteria bacterium]|nr:hypothetical protein [Candidatus Levybacteria bacterium]
MVEAHKPHEPNKKTAKVIGCIVGSSIILHGLSALTLSTQHNTETEEHDRAVSYAQQGAVEIVSGAIVLLATFSRKKR